MSSEESFSGPAPESQEGQRRRRTKYDKNQSKILFEAFKSDAYPDINVRMALAERIKVPEPRIQGLPSGWAYKEATVVVLEGKGEAWQNWTRVWFQNRRARDPRSRKNTKEKARPLVPEPIHGRVGAPVPRPSQGGLCAPNCPCQQCLLAAQKNASLFSSKPGNASDQADFGGYVGNPSMNMASHNLPTAADEPSGDLLYSLSSSFSLHCFSSGFNPKILNASQQSSPQLEAGCAETYVGDPEQFLAQGDEPPQGYGQCPPSGEQQPWWNWQPSPAPKPEMEFEQPLSQSLEAAVPPWSCWSLPPTPASSPPQPPLPQELCSHPASSQPFPKKARANMRNLFHPYL
ncbi:double homeobox protein 4C-like [Bos mutus]|uniref:double homeobox protein 4C-like n=1 Tax=Bos mutus TaxID=72004 RepID=UPI0038B48D7D